jgi:hypothetical protein
VPVGAAALIVALKILPKDRAAPASATQFDLPGALTVTGGLTALMFGLASTEAHGRLSARTLTALSLSAVLLAAFAIIERRARRPLVAPHTWKVVTLVAGTTVMLGVTAILAGTVFLTSIFFQAVLGFSPLLAAVAFLPLALAITAGTHLVSELVGLGSGPAPLPDRNPAPAGAGRWRLGYSISAMRAATRPTAPWSIVG